MSTHVIYGGTFDMPHNGHRATFDWLCSQGHEVSVVPAIGHEFKPYAVGSYVYRRRMCELTFGTDWVYALEEQVLTHKPLPIMAIDVLRALRRIRPSMTIMFAVGPDVNVERWTGINEIRADGFGFVRVPEVPTARSSTIRELIATGKPWEHLVPKQVAAFIRLHKLYGYKEA